MKRNIFRQIISLMLTAVMLFPTGSLQSFAQSSPFGASSERELSELENRASIESLTITPEKTDGVQNRFSYTAYSGKSWTSSSSEAYIDLGTSDIRAGECYYEIYFVGNAINLYAVKSFNHGKVVFTVDGEYAETVNLYNSSRTSPQVVYSVENLAEGPHVLKAVTLNEREGSSVVNQVSYAEIFHAPYIPQDIKLAAEEYLLIAGETQLLRYQPIPEYTSFTDLVFSSSRESVATVSPEGVITAHSTGSAEITLSSEISGLAKTVYVTVTEGSVLTGSIVDTNTQYTQDRYDEVKGINQSAASLTAWKNDKAVSQLVLASRGADAEEVTVTASDFTCGSHIIPSSQITATYVKSTLAYNGSYLGYGSTTRPVPEATDENRSESSDILYQTTPIDIPANTLQPVWICFTVPKDATAGIYTGTLTVASKEEDTPLIFTYTLEVQDAFLPDASDYQDEFDIELWQYPYSSAEYYGVEPFSEEHLALMESTMLKYKEIGGHAITTSIVEEAWNGQTYSKNEVHYPSMVKWSKNEDGSFQYDYTDFDKWVEFNKSLGIGDKIVLYSIAPWHSSFTYWEGNALHYESFTPGSARYTRVWTDFLQDMIEHLMDKGWFEDAYIGIDERGFCTEAFDLIDSVKNIHGLSLKTAGAMDGFVDKKALALRVTDLNVGDTAAAAHPVEFAELLESRESLGLRTTLYSCTEHQPGNFSLSAPAESYWSAVNAGKMGAAGFLRWAYDAWVEDPLRDTTHNAFEPGDCFLVYPDEKDAGQPSAKSSLRLEKMAEGIRDVNKLKVIVGEVPALEGEAAKVYGQITMTASTSQSYLSAEARAQLSDETDAFKEALAKLTEDYIERKATGTQDVDSLTIPEGSFAELIVGDTLQLTAVLKPDNLLNNKVSWSSSKPSIASVSSTGLVTAKKVGQAVITVVSNQDSSKSASFTVQISPLTIEEEAKVSYYSFDSMEDNRVADEWGGRNATGTGATLSAGKAGNALAVTESEKSLKLEGESGLGDTWTVGFWVYSATTDGIRNSILMSEDKNYSFDARLAADRPKAGVHTGTGSGDVLTYQYDFPINTWIHMAWTQDKVNGLSLYINGSLIQTNNWTVSHNFPCPLDLIGGTGFTGKIDELKVYNRVLTAAEINAIMQVPGLNISETSKALYVGDTYSIDAVLISDQEDKTITYTSNAPEVAQVDEDGIVTALKKGTALITVENKSGGFSQTVVITVEKRLNISNKLPVYQLGEQYLSTIDKDETNAQGRRYLGQPDMVMLDDNKTLVTAYPKGHGKGPLILKISYDAGETWTEKTNTPTSWEGSQETPTLYKLHLATGEERLILITACPGWGTDSGGYQTGWNTSYSDDGGETWTEYQHWYTNHADGTTNNSIVAMASLIQLKDENGNDIQKWMGVYHDYGYVNYKTYLTFDENGNEQWSEPEPYLSDYRAIESSYQMCEIGMFRSPDGNRIVGLARSQSHNNPATLIYSDDEGETWSKPMDLPGSLAGERHKAVYDPISGRLVITFREINYDKNGNNQFDGADDWMAGDWGAWVGTYDDLMNQEEGEYRILLAEDWANNTYSGDTGYAGIVVQPDGTFIMNSYGHWDKDFSLSWTGGVTTDLCYIRQAKFKLADLERDHGLVSVDFTLLKEAISSAEKITDQNSYTPESWSHFLEALNSARDVADNAESSQSQVDNAVKALLKAQEELEMLPAPPAVDKTDLYTAIQRAKAISSQGNYTDASWNVFISSLEKASAVYHLVSASQAQVDEARQNLETAQARLQTKPAQNNPPKEETPVPPAQSTLSAPASVKTSSVRYDRIRITWSAVQKADGYRIYRSNKKRGVYQLIGELTSTKRSYTDNKRKTGKTYYYKVCAYARSGGQSIFSPFTSSKAGKALPGKAVLASSKKVSGMGVKLKWKKVPGATGYAIYRSTKKKGTYRIQKIRPGGKATTYTDAKVSSNKTYYYKIRAYRKVGKKRIYGMYSNIRKAK